MKMSGDCSGGTKALTMCIGLILIMLVWLAEAKDYSILASSYLTSGSSVVQNFDAFVSWLMLPLALEHFNTRYAGVIPEMAKLPQNCTTKMSFVDNMLIDSVGQSSVAMNEFISRYLGDPFDIILAPTSNVAVPIAVTAGALNIPVMSHVAGSDALSDKTTYPTFFRVIPSDGLRAQLIARLLSSFKYRAFGLIYVNDAFGNAYRASLQSACASYNIRLVAASYTSGLTGDAMLDQLRQAMKVIISERIRIINLAGVDNSFIFAMAQVADEFNWIDDRLYFFNRPVTPDVLANAPDKELFLRFVKGALTVYVINEPTPAYKALVKLWPTINATFINQYLPNFTASNGETLRIPNDFFIQNPPETPLFDLRLFTAAYDSIIALGFATCGPSTSLTSNLAGVKFNGTSGYVGFDQNYNRKGIVISLDNIQLFNGTFRFVSVGEAIQGNWSINMDEIVFNSGTNMLPLDIDPPDNNVDQLTYGARIWGIVEASLAVVASLVILIYMMRHRHDQAIVESQPIFMFLLACGCLIMGLSIVGLVIETDAGCMLFPWLFTLGFTLALSSLSAKSTRVAVLWYSRGPIQKRNNSVRATVLLGGVACSMIALLCILIAWQVVAPLEFTVTVTKMDLYSYPLYSSAMCIAPSSLSTTFLALVITYVCLVVFVTMWVSFWVRNAPEKFQEARMTAIAGVSMFQVFLVGIPTAAAVWNSALPRFLVLSSLSFLLCLIILATMFLPKIYRDRFGVEHSSDVRDRHDPLVDPSVDQSGPNPILKKSPGGQVVGVINQRGKKRRRDIGSETQVKRSIIERVLETVEETDGEEENEEEDAKEHEKDKRVTNEDENNIRTTSSS